MVSVLVVLSNLNFGKNVCSTFPNLKSPLFGGKLSSFISKPTNLLFSSVIVAPNELAWVSGFLPS